MVWRQEGASRISLVLVRGIVTSATSLRGSGVVSSRTGGGACWRKWLVLEDTGTPLLPWASGIGQVETSLDALETVIHRGLHGFEPEIVAAHGIDVFTDAVKEARVVLQG